MERDARGVTVYLLPGLTGRQRKTVIRRLRQEASRGFGPALPLPGLLLALGRDRVRAAVVTLLAIVRLHPASALLPGAAVAAMTLFVLACASGGPGPAPQAGLDGALTATRHSAPAPAGSASAGQASADSGSAGPASAGPASAGPASAGSPAAESDSATSIPDAPSRTPVVSPALTRGGSELGSGSLAPMWQARPHSHHPHRPRHRPHHPHRPRHRHRPPSPLP